MIEGHNRDLPQQSQSKGNGHHPVLKSNETGMKSHLLKIVPLLIGIAASVPIVSGSASTPTTPRTIRGEKEEAVAEDLIRQRVEDYAKAVSAKDIDRVMSFFAPNMVSFDLEPPLRYAGADNKRRRWLEAFTAYDRIAYEVRELNVTAHGELAFVRGLNHFKGTFANGHITNTWVRWTACFRRIDGVWLVVHDHVSVPADLKHGQAVLNLTP